MTDEQKRELLEAAARAAGLRLTWGEKYRVGDEVVDCTDVPYALSGSPDVGPVYWNPLEDDGDALRLAVRLRIKFRYNEALGQALAWTGGSNDHEALASIGECMGDENACARLAITRAAAEIGRQMQSAAGAGEG